MRSASSCNTAGAEGCRMARVGQAVSLAPPTFEVKPCGSNLVAPIALYPHALVSQLWWERGRRARVSWGAALRTGGWDMRTQFHHMTDAACDGGLDANRTQAAEAQACQWRQEGGTGAAERGTRVSLPPDAPESSIAGSCPEAHAPDHPCRREGRVLPVGTMRNSHAPHDASITARSALYAC